MKKYLIIALTAALLLAFFGCGDPPAAPPEKTLDLSDFDKTELTLPESESAAIGITGESSSKLYKFTGDDFKAIKEAKAGSMLEVVYQTSVAWGCGEIGWVDINNAGPVIHGDTGSKKTRTAQIPVEFLVFGDDHFTIHIFNGADVLEVTLYGAPEGYKPEKNPKDSGGKAVFVPYGNKPNGKGDISKADIKKILKAADTAKLVFYFDDEEETEKGILKLAAKEGPPSYDLVEPSLLDWVRIDKEDKTASIEISKIKAAMKLDEGITKLDINLSNMNKELLYIEIVGDEAVSCECP